MKTKARFRVVGRFDSAGPQQEGTVIIDRGAGIFGVRPLHKRRIYELPLSTVAEMVAARIQRAEVFAARIAKANKKKRGY